MSPRYSVTIRWSDEDEAYIATVPELPGLSAFGDSEEETFQELEIAREAFLDALREARTIWSAVGAASPHGDEGLQKEDRREIRP